MCQQLNIADSQKTIITQGWKVTNWKKLFPTEGNRSFNYVINRKSWNGKPLSKAQIFKSPGQLPYMQCLTEIKIEDLAYRPTTTYLQRRRPRKRRRRVTLLHNSLNSIGEPTVPEDPEKKQLLYIHRDPERDKHKGTLGLEPARKMGFLCHLVLNNRFITISSSCNYNY